MSDLNNISNIRREYGDAHLNDQDVDANPLVQFELWFTEAIKQEQSDPTAMVLSTVDAAGMPDSRVVLLKGIEQESFIFFTNYSSTKGLQLEHNPQAALNFYWPHLARQVRIRGLVEQLSADSSDLYFASRPTMSQYAAIVSPQSKVIPSREFLEQAFVRLSQQEDNQKLERPNYWGGYRVLPQEIEFWQGRNNRLHDRILYCRQAQHWLHQRLAP